MAHATLTIPGPALTLLVARMMAPFLIPAWILAAAPMPAWASIINSSWNGGEGDWSQALLWSPNQVPDNDGVDVFDVFIDGDGGIASTVFQDVSVTIENLTVDEEDALVILPGITLAFTPGAAIENRELIQVNLIRLDGETQLFGGGTLRFDDSPLNQIFSVLPAGALDNVDNVVEGEGRIDLATFHNRHVVDANGGPGRELTIVSGPGGVTNDHLIQATDGTLVFNTGVDGTSVVNGVDGVIQAVGGSSVVQLRAGASIEGGALQGVDGGQVICIGFGSSSPKLTDLTLRGDVVFDGPVTGVWKGEIHNEGVVSVVPGTPSSIATVSMDGPVTLLGGGELFLGADIAVPCALDGLAAGAHLINGDNVIRGDGAIGQDDLQVTNRGTIEANRSRALVIDTDDGGFANEGMLAASGTGGLSILEGPFVTSGAVEVQSGSVLSRNGDFVQTAGTTRVDGFLTATGEMDIQGGVLAGAGVIEAAVRVAGTLAPGTSPGLLTIGGALTFVPGSTFVVELGGLVAGAEHDKVSVSGDVQLAGTLEIVLVDGFVPNPGDVFEILEASGFSGAFGAISAPPGTAFSLSEEDGVLSLVADDVAEVPDAPTSPAAGGLARLAVAPHPVPEGGAYLELWVADARSSVDLGLFDAAGRLVREFRDAPVGSETRSLRWDGRDVAGHRVPSGTYYLLAHSGSETLARRTIVVVR